MSAHSFGNNYIFELIKNNKNLQYKIEVTATGLIQYHKKPKKINTQVESIVHTANLLEKVMIDTPPTSRPTNPNARIIL